MSVRIVRLIPCPTWTTFLRALAHRRDPEGPAVLLWQRQCHDCGAAIAVSEEVMDQIKVEPGCRLVCEQCVEPDSDAMPAGLNQ